MEIMNFEIIHKYYCYKLLQIQYLLDIQYIESKRRNLLKIHGTPCIVCQAI